MKKKNSVYLLGKLSSNQLEEFKKDLIEHSIHSAMSVKGLKFSKEEIEQVVKNAVESVILRYNPKNGEILGNMVKTQVFADLRDKFSKLYPDRVDKIKWPDLAQKHAATKLLEVVQKLQNAPKAKADKIIASATEELKGRQSKLLSAILEMEKSTTFGTLSDKLGVSNGTISNDVKVVYKILMEAIKNSEIEL